MPRTERRSIDLSTLEIVPAREQGVSPLNATPRLRAGWWRLEGGDGHPPFRAEFWNRDTGDWCEAPVNGGTTIYLSSGCYELTLKECEGNPLPERTRLTLRRSPTHVVALKVGIAGLNKVSRRIGRREFAPLFRSALALWQRRGRPLAVANGGANHAMHHRNPCHEHWLDSLQLPRAPTTYPSVSVVVPTRDRPALLQACLEGLLAGTDYPDLELVIVDNGTCDTEALAILSRADGDPRVCIIQRDEPFNFSRLCNVGVATARGEIVVLFNNDVTPLDARWLKTLVAWFSDPAVGGAGPLLLYPNGKVQAAGLVLGMGGLVGHAWRGAEPDTGPEPVRVPRRVSALTGACFAVRRDAYLLVGGMDEDAFPVTLNDVDLSMKLAAAGLSLVYDPAARLTHHESVSRPPDSAPGERARRLREMNAFRDRWRGWLIDPFYDPQGRLDD